MEIITTFCLIDFIDKKNDIDLL